MKVVELMKICTEMMKVLHKSGIKVSDYEYLPLIAEFENMKREGEKTTYAVASLAEKYGICERKVYKILRKARRDCTI